MGNDDPRIVKFPGERLGTVEDFRPLRALGRDEDLVGILGVTGAERRVTVVAVESGRSCMVDALPEGGSDAALVPYASEDLGLYYETLDEEGRGRLHFVDAQCEEPVAPIDDATLVPFSDRLMPSAAMVHTGSDELWVVEPTQRRKTLLDQGVTTVAISMGHVSEQVNGELVIRDMGLEEQYRFGQEVTELLVDTRREELVYIDRSQLFWLDAPGEEPVQVADDACMVAFADPPSRDNEVKVRHVSYFSPCSERRLVIYDLRESRSIDVGVAPHSQAAVRVMGEGKERRAWVFYRTSERVDEMGFGELAAMPEGGEAIPIGNGSLDEIGFAVSAGVYYRVVDAEQERVHLLTPSGAIRSRYEGASAFTVATYPARALVDFDGETGTLVDLESPGAPGVLAEGSPTVGRGTAGGTVFGADTTDGVGQLRVRLASDDITRNLADGVPVASAQLAMKSALVSYLTQYDVDRKTGELCAVAAATWDRFCTEDVSAFAVVTRPERGIAYVRREHRGWGLFWAVVE